MKIAFSMTLALLAAAVNGSPYGMGYASSGKVYASSRYSVAQPYGGSFGSYSGARAQNYYPSLASSYYNPTQATPYTQYQALNPYMQNIYNPYPTNGYQAYSSAIYNPSRFVGSTIANQYLSSSSFLSPSSQPVGNVCPTTTSRTIIISDYIKYGVPQTYPCIGNCVFQPNVVLDNISTQNYDKADVVVLMVGPYSYPNTATYVLNNATLLSSLATRTNLYLTTIPVRPSVTDAAVLTATANANALVRTAANANPAASLLDYQSFYNSFVSKNENQWTGVQMCNWLREQIPSPIVPANSPSPAIPGTLAPF